MKDVLAKGAEADVLTGEYMGLPSVIKVRMPKSYRHPEIDERIRLNRMKNEARLLKEARYSGVRTPFVYDVDLSECSITMELVQGEKVKDILEQHPEYADAICSRIGETIGRLHNARISHGDLTTSNMILTDDGICVIDFSLGMSKADDEAIGVDVHLMERAFHSAHPGMEDAFDMLMTSYMSTVNDPKTITKKVEEIKNRGRYT